MRTTAPNHRRRVAAAILALAALSAGLLTIGPAASASQLPSPAIDAGVRAGSEPSAIPGFQCFVLGSGQSPSTAVTLRTSNFGVDRVVVKESKLACESALRYPARQTDTPAPDRPQVLQCFNIANGIDPNREVTLSSETVRVSAIVGKAQMMCENATKFRPGLKSTGRRTETAWQCFDLEEPTPSDETRATVVTQNWGAATDTIGRATFLCEEARKTRREFEPYGASSGTAYVCSIFGGPTLLQSAILKTRNFGSDGVIFGASALWCEWVEKTLGPATIVVPAGHSVTLARTELDGCNNLAYGYQVNSGPLHQLGQTIAACTTVGFSDVTVGPFAGDVEFRVFLRDDSCARTYFSDGDHARVAAILKGYEVAIRDAGGACEIADLPAAPSTQAGGNLRVALIIQ